MWSITPNDATEMYKRFLLARYREGALEVATTQAALFSEKGDLPGSEAWEQVAAKIKSEQDRSPKLALS